MKIQAEVDFLHGKLAWEEFWVLSGEKIGSRLRRI